MDIIFTKQRKWSRLKWSSNQNKSVNANSVQGIGSSHSKISDFSQTKQHISTKIYSSSVPSLSSIQPILKRKTPILSDISDIPQYIRDLPKT